MPGDLIEMTLLNKTVPCLYLITQVKKTTLIAILLSHKMAVVEATDYLDCSWPDSLNRKKENKRFDSIPINVIYVFRLLKRVCCTIIMQKL